MTVNGGAATEISDSGETAAQTLLTGTSVPSGTTADFVYTTAAAVDSTCERFVMMLWAVITSTDVTVDFVTDTSATGDFDLSNVAVTSGGAEIVAIVTYPNAACGGLDATFNGTETVTEDVNTTFDTAVSYAGGHFTADSTATIDDYTNISCGTETDGKAIAISWEPPV